MKPTTIKIQCACGCGNLLDNYDSQGHPRRYIHGHNRPFLGKNHSAYSRKKISTTRKGINVGAESPAWKGGRTGHNGGYIRVRQLAHPTSNNGYILEHRLVMEKVLGRLLYPGEVVHHIDGDRTNNTPENLKLFASNAEHTNFHNAEKNKNT